MAMLKARVRYLAELFVSTATRFSDVEGPRLGAAFAYYATFSIFPAMLLAVTVFGFFLGDDAPARERMLSAIGTPATRELLERTLLALQESKSSRGLSALVAMFTLLFSASGATVELDNALNRIWRVPPRESSGIMGSIKAFVHQRLTGFAIVAGLGLTLLASLVGSSLLSALAGRAQAQLEIPLWTSILRTGELVLSITLLSGVFTAAFHFIPRTRPRVQDVVGGAVFTTAILTAVKELFASYLSGLTNYSAYGVVGGVLALATWIFLSSQVIFFGAQLTRVHAEMIGSAPGASEERAQADRRTTAGGTASAPT